MVDGSEQRSGWSELTAPSCPLVRSVRSRRVEYRRDSNHKSIPDPAYQCEQCHLVQVLEVLRLQVPVQLCSLPLLWPP
jgi:hypothetical protein